jgi:hypothetical protein
MNVDSTENHSLGLQLLDGNADAYNISTGDHLRPSKSDLPRSTR